MFWFAEAAEAAHGAAENAEEAEHHSPIIVDLVNHYFGEYAYRFEMAYTKPKWDWFLGFFGTTAEDEFGKYTPENAIPWYTVMFVIACILSVTIIWILKGQLSEEEPGHGQQTLELGVLAVRSMLEDIDVVVSSAPEPRQQHEKKAPPTKKGQPEKRQPTKR